MKFKEYELFFKNTMNIDILHPIYTREAKQNTKNFGKFHINKDKHHITTVFIFYKTFLVCNCAHKLSHNNK